MTLHLPPALAFALTTQPKHALPDMNLRLNDALVQHP